MTVFYELEKKKYVSLQCNCWLLIVWCILDIVTGIGWDGIFVKKWKWLFELLIKVTTNMHLSVEYCSDHKLLIP